MMKRNDFLMVIATGIVALFVAFAFASNMRTAAQDTGATWEYAALAYDGNIAFAYTPDPAATDEINKVYEGMAADDLNAVIALNVMGARGWEYVDYQPGETVVYMFKRPKGSQ